MEQRKNLCAMIPVGLHERVRNEQEKAGITLSEYVTTILTEYYDGRNQQMSEKIRTLAFQVPESLFRRVKIYLAGHPGLSQKDFMAGLIEAAVTAWEQEQTVESGGAMEGISEFPEDTAEDGGLEAE